MASASQSTSVCDDRIQRPPQLGPETTDACDAAPRRTLPDLDDRRRSATQVSVQNTQRQPTETGRTSME